MRPRTQNFEDMTAKRLFLLPLLVCLGLSACKEGTTGAAHTVARGISKKPAFRDAKQHSTDKEAGQFRIEDVVLLSPKAAAFQKLTNQEKRLALLYSKVATAIDLNEFRRNGPTNGIIQAVLLGILEAGTQVPSPIRNKITQYTNLFLLNHGTQNTVSQKPFEPLFIPGELAAAAQIAQDRGIDLGLEAVSGANLAANQIEQLETMLKTIRPGIYHHPEEDADSGQRASNGKPNNAVRSHLTQLRRGLNLMAPETREDIEKLLSHLENGDPELFLEYRTSWVETAPSVDFYLDSGDPKGLFAPQTKILRSLVAVKEREASQRLSDLVKKTPLWEKRLPVDDRFKRNASEIIIPTVGVYHLLAAAGGQDLQVKTDLRIAAPDRTTSAGRDKYMFFSNLYEAQAKYHDASRIRAFSFDEETVVRRLKCGREARFAHIVLRETIGRNVGKMSDNRTGKAEKYLKELTPLVDEIHAESAALYLALEPPLVESGFLSEGECAKAIYDEFLSEVFENYAVLGGLTPTHNTHRAQRILLRSLIDHGAAEIALREEHYYPRVIDYHAMQATLGSVLKQVQRMKSTGNFLQTKDWLSKNEHAPLSSWQESLHKRKKELKLPSRLGYLFPVLEPRYDATGQIKDVEIYYPSDLIDRALHLRRAAKLISKFEIRDGSSS